MDLNDLSSNWRKLQATLSSTKSNSKRKASDDILQPQRNGVKKLRTTPKQQPSSETRRPANEQDKKMGLVLSHLKPKQTSASLALWAEDNDVSAKDLAAAYGSASTLSLATSKYKDTINGGLSSNVDVGKYISIDCEMVGVGPDGNDSALARVSIVNYHGHQIYDSFVQTKEAVTDYRTFVSGITPKLLREARTFETVQADVSGLLQGKILIGHSVKNDLEALLLGHPKRDIRDTSRHPAYRRLAGGKTPGLKKLAKQLLDVDIQGGEHSSIEDARTTMLLFRREKDGFEQEHQRRWGPPRGPTSSASNGKPRTTHRKKKSKKSKK
ncbi:MAG: hypothetical protein Q9174_002189 [Haloplaca sp. 1 TL-2023]